MLCGYVAYKRPAPASITRGRTIPTSKVIFVHIHGQNYNQRVNIVIHGANIGKRVDISTRAGGIFHQSHGFICV